MKHTHREKRIKERTSVSWGKGESGRDRKILEEIMVKIIPHLMESQNSQIQKAQKTQRNVKHKKHVSIKEIKSTCIIIQLFKTCDKEKDRSSIMFGVPNFNLRSPTRPLLSFAPLFCTLSWLLSPSLCHHSPLWDNSYWWFWPQLPLERLPWLLNWWIAFLRVPRASLTRSHGMC